jgi:hypothetical protein
MMTSGFGTVPILIIAGFVIVTDLVIGLLMFSNKKTVLKVNSISTHSHHEMQEKSLEIGEVKHE